MFAVRGNVKLLFVWTFKKKLRRMRAEHWVGFDRDGHHLVAISIEQLSAVRRPLWKIASIIRYLPCGSGIWIRNHIDLRPSGAVRLIRHPSTIRRKLGPARYKF